MDWDRGFSSRVYATFVDPNTWRDQAQQIDIIDGSVKRSLDDLREAADLTCSSSYEETSERWIRIWLDAKQSDSSSHIPIFTGLAISPGRTLDGNFATKQVQCYSVLKPAQDVLLQRGWYAPASISSKVILENLLSVTPAVVDVEDNAPMLENPIIAMDGETHLSMALRIVDAIGWQIKITGDGIIHVVSIPKKLRPVRRLDAFSYDIIETNVDISYDWYSCPNVFRAIIGDTVAIARDDDPNSRFSTVTRGREIWAEDSNGALNSDETIASYAERRLKELQRVYLEVSYTRRFDPEINILDMVDINYPKQQLQGSFLVLGQNIKLGGNMSVAEEVRAYG